MSEHEPQPMSSSRIRVKVCGITSETDAYMAINAGADAIGLVFYESSPRAVSIEQAASIARAVGPFVTVVGLFVDANADFIEQVLAQVPLHVLQFHGNETDVFCAQFKRPYYKAIRMKPDLNVETAIAAYPNAGAILLDAYRKGVPGGTGDTFDWQRVPQQHTQLIILAGGLTPSNVAQAVISTQPYGVDVSGGVEQSPGHKNNDKLISFIDRAHTR